MVLMVNWLQITLVLGQWFLNLLEKQIGAAQTIVLLGLVKDSRTTDLGIWYEMSRDTW
jgi:hypothetical protein